MNREESRKYRKNLNKLGVKQKELQDVLILQEMMKHYKELPSGAKVKVKYKELIDRMKSKGQKYNEKYLSWLEENKDTVFTVDRNDEKARNGLVCFSEDTTDPRWLVWEGGCMEIKQ